jgi:hypothetical protein
MSKHGEAFECLQAGELETVEANMKRVISGTLLGGIALFVWSAISHSVLLIGAGFSPLPDEDKIISTLNSSIKEQGLYFFPGKDFRRSTPEQEATWLEKYRTGPAGMIIYRPVGGEPFSPNKLLIQLLASFVTAGIISFVISLIAASYWERVAATTLLGLLACSAVSIIYWNWYEYPTSFFAAQIVDQVVGFFLAGLVIAKIATSRKSDRGTGAVAA